ncbi:MAG: hypothetical protein JWR59_1334, partial [Brevundimonas sp.]|nr:hypothetical protein [Brevundimonas sp.]
MTDQTLSLAEPARDRSFFGEPKALAYLS